MKLAVIYDSVTGNTKQAAECIAEGISSIKMAHYRKPFQIFGARFARKAAELFALK